MSLEKPTQTYPTMRDYNALRVAIEKQSTGAHIHDALTCLAIMG